MARYEYRCEACGAFDVVRPMGAAAGAERCPSCGGDARRMFSAPALTAPRSALRLAHEAADRSADEPAVRRAPPAAAPRRPRSANPLHAKLPRP